MPRPRRSRAARPTTCASSITLPQWGASIGKWAADNGIKKVYTIISDYAPGHDAEAYFTKAFKAGGGEIIGGTRTPIQETNFAVYMEKALQAKPDAVYMFQPGGSPSIAFVKALRRTRPQAGRHQAARQWRIRRTLSAEFHRRRDRHHFGQPLHRNQLAAREQGDARPAHQDVRRQGRDGHRVGRGLGRHGATSTWR